MLLQLPVCDSLIYKLQKGKKEKAMAASLLSPCNPRFYCASHGKQFLGDGQRSLHLAAPKVNKLENRKIVRRLLVPAATEDSSKSEESIPAWARPDADEPPPWARDEPTNSTTSQQSFQPPFYIYLLASAITAIAAIGSVFEYVNQRPVFGILNSDSIFYAPLLGFFAFTGLPTSVFLWFKSVQAANKEAEEQDRRDGFL